MKNRADSRSAYDRLRPPYGVAATPGPTENAELLRVVLEALDDCDRATAMSGRQTYATLLLSSAVQAEELLTTKDTARLRQAVVAADLESWALIPPRSSSRADQEASLGVPKILPWRVVFEPGVRIREVPNGGSQVIGHLRAGDLVNASKVASHWLRCEHPTYGFVQSALNLPDGPRVELLRLELPRLVPPPPWCHTATATATAASATASATAAANAAANAPANAAAASLLSSGEGGGAFSKSACGGSTDDPTPLDGAAFWAWLQAREPTPIPRSSVGGAPASRCSVGDVGQRARLGTTARTFIAVL